MSEDTNPFESESSDNIVVDLEGLEPSSLSKQVERNEISQQVEAFLAAGGKIDYVEPNVLADPPKKPTSNYGSQPI